MSPKIIVIKKGALVVETLTQWCIENRIDAATLSAIGAIENAEICYYDLGTKSYLCQTISEAAEVLSFVGNVTIKEGKPFVHAHVTLGDRQMNTKGGHLKEAIVAVTLECLITPIEGNYVRTHNEDIGLYLIDPFNA